MTKTNTENLGTQLAAAARKYDEAAEIYRKENDTKTLAKKTWDEAYSLLPAGDQRTLSYVVHALDRTARNESPYLVFEHCYSLTEEQRKTLVEYLTKTDLPAVVIDRDPTFLMNDLLDAGWRAARVIPTDYRKDDRDGGKVTDRNRGVLFVRDI